MKKIFILTFLALSGWVLRAQVPEGYTMVDSLVLSVVPAASADSSLVGKSVFDVLPECVSVNQSQAVRSALSVRTAENSEAMISGYRIRIYFDNGQKSRYESESTMMRFKTRHPEVQAYRTFTSPYFKVTVGDYRTRSEALAALKAIQPEFPAAFIVRDKFKYPQVVNSVTVRVDTLHVLRKL